MIALVFLILWSIKRFRQIPKRPPGTTQKVVENMVCCAYCGVHLPESESISAEHDQYFCCTKHQQLYLQTGDKQKVSPTQKQVNR